MALKKLRHHRDGRDALVEAGSETEKHFLDNGFVEARDPPPAPTSPASAPAPGAQDNARRVPRGQTPPPDAAA